MINASSGKPLVTCYDSEYKATKLVKQGRAALEPLFAELAAWIATAWNVTVLNVIHNEIEAPRRVPRLQIIVEHANELQVFKTGFNFDPTKQQAIVRKFAELASRNGSSTYETAGLLVVFSAFAPLAREEADSRIPEADVWDLQIHIANPDLWTIHRCFGRVVFMFYTDSQARAHVQSGRLEGYADRYFKLLRQHDEFGYLDRGEFSVESDSKENFDKNYNGSWFNYAR